MHVPDSIQSIFGIVGRLAAILVFGLGVTAANAQYAGDKIKPGWCAPGSQRLADVEITGEGRWKADDFTNQDCTNLNYQVENIQHGGNQLTWSVPFTNANIQCSCQVAQSGGGSGGNSGGGGGDKITAGMCQPNSEELVSLRKKVNVTEASKFKAGDFTDKDCADKRYSVSDIKDSGTYLTWMTPFIKWEVGCRCLKP